VRRELFRRRATKNRIRALLRENAFIAYCDDYDQTAVDVLLAERRVRGQKDRGEAEQESSSSERSDKCLLEGNWARADQTKRRWVDHRSKRLGAPPGSHTAPKHFTAILFQGVWVYSEVSRGGGHG
jgi:hypothetical protein